MDPIEFKKALGSEPGLLYNNPNVVGDVYQRTGINFGSEERIKLYMEKNEISFEGFDAKPLVEKKKSRPDSASRTKFIGITITWFGREWYIGSYS